MPGCGAGFYHGTLYSPAGAGGAAGMHWAAGAVEGDPRAASGWALRPTSGTASSEPCWQRATPSEDLLDAGLVRTKRREKTDENGNTVESVSTYDRFRNRVMFPNHRRPGPCDWLRRAGDGRLGRPNISNSPESMIFNKRKNLFAHECGEKDPNPTG